MENIEFRVWDIKNNKMSYYDDMFISEQCPAICFLIRNSEGRYVDDCAVPYDKNNFIIMQFTGIYDKNKVKIFEGDIILIDPEDMYRQQYIIKYGHGKYDCGCYSFIGFYLEQDGEQAEHTWWTNQRDRVEVIGNIYENPKLLEYKTNEHQT